MIPHFFENGIFTERKGDPIYISEWLNLLKQGLELLEEGRGLALVTLIRIEGSSYRGLGTRMLVDSHGQTYGHISGGCLEADVAIRAKLTQETGKAQWLHYDSRQDGDLLWGLGLGCDGTLDLLVENFSQRWISALFAHLSSIAPANGFALLSTAFQRVGNREVCIWGHELNGPLREPLIDAVHPLAKDFFALSRVDEMHATQKPWLHDISFKDWSLGIFRDVLSSPPRVWICGRGFDVEPIARLVDFLGWPVQIFCHKPLAGPEAVRLGSYPKTVCPPQACADMDNPTSNTAILIMTHHFETDKAYLTHFLGTKASYLGLLGPRSRTQRMLAELSETLTVDLLNDPRLFFPIGLDIGAESPREIALAVVAEIHTHFAGRNGGFLKHRRGPIHPR